MRATLILLLLFVLALVCVAARGQGDEEALPARVICEGGQLAALQIYVPTPGIITLRIPPNVCWRSA